MSDPSGVLVSPTSTDAAIAMMRRLAAAGIPVVGADDGYLPRWARTRHCRRWVHVPGARDQYVSDYLAEMVRACRPAAFLPVNTPATVAAIAHRPTLPAAVRTNLPPAEAFAVAAMLLRRSPGLRLVVKPRRDVGGGCGLHVVDDAEALAAAVRDVEEEFGGAVIQEYVPGGVARLRMALFLFGPDSRLVAAFTSRKLRQRPAEGGSATVSESTAEAILVEQMLPLFERWRWAGPAEVDFKQDERDGSFKVLEINPRFPGYLRFVDHCGLDLPPLAAMLALDPQAVSPLAFPAYDVGRRYVRPGPFLTGAAAELLRPGRRLGRLLEAAGDARGASLAGFLDDPLPWIGRLLVKPPD
jgi:predicted ATP-grasp superfamily ATP-dependent carboligase